MPRPQIRHIAIFADDTDEMAKFYVDVFEVLPHDANGQAVRGLNHFGFKVDSNAEIGERIARKGLRAPTKRPADRPYAEQRALDPEGNMFDISQHGFERVETENERSAEPAVAR
jgi:catechol 2,3-dioxygenase-like lactoylglutathione lyase family enzyme